MQIPSLVATKSGKSRCLADLGGGNKRCWKLKSVQPLDLPNTSSEANFTKIQLIELGLQTNGSFVVGVSWEGKSHGTLSFSGPKGTLFAVGTISKGPDGAVRIDGFSDESFSQQYDRGVVFGESEPAKLRQKTLEWLNDVLAPFIEKFVLNGPNQVHPLHNLNRQRIYDRGVSGLR
jgi:hypothetical protein